MKDVSVWENKIDLKEASNISGFTQIIHNDCEWSGFADISLDFFAR